MAWKRTHTGLAAAAALIAAIAILIVSSSGGAPTQAAQPQGPPAVTVASVEVRSIIEHDEFTGRVAPIDDVEVRARISGYLEAVRFQAGRRVTKGELLFAIDPRWDEAKVAATEALVAQAQVKIDNAEREWKRAEQLLQTRAISAEESEARAARLAEERAALLVAKAARDTAALDLEHTQVRAPVDGRVGRALVTPGNYITGGESGATVLTTLVSTNPVFVLVDIDEASLLRLQRLMREGDLALDAEGRVRIRVALADEPDYPHEGIVESLENRLDPGTGSILLRALVPNPDERLVPGMFARMRVPASAAKPTVLVSDRAISTDQSQKFVYVLGPENKAEYRAVKLGPLVDGKRVIREGLSAGDKIIVNGLQRVQAGSPVTPETAVQADAAATR